MPISALINLGMAPNVAMGMVYCTGANSIGLLMHNAIINENLSKITGRASVEQCLAMLLASGAAGAAAKGE